MMRDWIGGALIIISIIAGFVWMLGQSSSQSHRIERDFREACAKVNGMAVWNNKYWECLK
jgi:hypothetical protein